MAPTWFRQCFWTLAVIGGTYVAAILALTIPVVQRNVTYAHNVNPARWQNLSNVEQFGFVHHQVQPFTVKSTDNVTLYAWHILPLHLYSTHQKQLLDQKSSDTPKFEKAVDMVGLKLLLNDPRATVIVSFHGNAAHIGSSYRPATYQQFLSLSTEDKPVHVIAFDYRGFGWSTGSPSEQGVIDDGIAVISALCGQSSVMKELKMEAPKTASHLSPSQIMLVGQSLGTFISTATFHEWVIRYAQQPFKALVLLASFSSLPKLLDSYSIKGLTPPVLSPLTQYPWAQKWFRGMVRDKWDLVSRLTDLLLMKRSHIDVSLMHAKDDWEIPYREGYVNWLAVESVANGTGTITSTHADWMFPELTKIWTSSDGTKRVQWEKVRHGGHNRVPTSEHAKLLISQALDRNR